MLHVASTLMLNDAYSIANAGADPDDPVIVDSSVAILPAPAALAEMPATAAAADSEPQTAQHAYASIAGALLHCLPLDLQRARLHWAWIAEGEGLLA